MKAVLKTFCIVAFLFLVVETHSQSIDFKNYQTWEEVLKAAKDENKPIFVDVYTDWCRYCKKLDKEVFNVASVADFYNDNFISVKINAEDEAMGTKFAKKHNIKGYPTLVYFDNKGNWVHQISGFRDAEKFIDAGWDATNEEKQLVSFQTKFEKGEDELEFLSKYLDALKNAGLESADASAKYVSQLSDMDIIDDKHWDVITYHFFQPDSEEFKRMLMMKKALEKKHGTAEVNDYMENVYNYKISSILKSEDEEALKKFKLDVRSQIPDLADKLSSHAEYLFYKNSDDMHEYAIKYLSQYCSNSRELNSAAWNYYENVDDEGKLNDALFWAMKSIRLDENWYNTDTKAHLLYKLGRYEDAQKAAQRSIEIGIESGEDPAETKELLDKINKSIKGN